MEVSLIGGILTSDYSKQLHTAGHTHPFTPIRLHIHSLIPEVYMSEVQLHQPTHSHPFISICSPLMQQCEKLGALPQNTSSCEYCSGTWTCSFPTTNQAHYQTAPPMPRYHIPINKIVGLHEYNYKQNQNSFNSMILVLHVWFAEWMKCSASFLPVPLTTLFIHCSQLNLSEMNMLACIFDELIIEQFNCPVLDETFL